ncbi:pseudouridylate synthase 1 homolog isoform X2 [Lineus longissimus]|uniref:pseudouridylate synthase 1 homolog isoform X2 n=1 Tax=Lineus longissimus TaxID=88925 RepID=UPI00315DD054
MLRKLVNRAGAFLKSTKISKVLSGNDAFVKMAESPEPMALKRPAIESEDPEAKKLKTDDPKAAEVTSAGAKIVEVSKDGESGKEGEVTPRKKKVALFMMYSGVGYYGMQYQPRDTGLKSIEGELLNALVSVGAIPEEHAAHTQKMSFQRAARTDKGVSAAGNCVSIKLFYNIPNLKEKINAVLPEQIKVIDILRTTAAFDSKNYCDSRTYSYMLPTFAFTPIENVVYRSFRAPDGTIKRVNDLLGIYKGTHNFHNFTSGKKPHEMSANRFIIDIKCSEPFIQDDIEFAIITVKGQSFMLHQIRKMIGLMIAVVRGLASVDCIQKSFGPYKTDVPKAPGLGLMLEKLHYDSYNRRFGKDGVHIPLGFERYEDDITEFKKKYIYSTMVKTEKEENSMMAWMRILHCHKFDYRVRMDPEPPA